MKTNPKNKPKKWILPQISTPNLLQKEKTKKCFFAFFFFHDFFLFLVRFLFYILFLVLYDFVFFFGYFFSCLIFVFSFLPISIFCSPKQITCWYENIKCINNKQNESNSDTKIRCKIEKKIPKKILLPFLLVLHECYTKHKKMYLNGIFHFVKKVHSFFLLFSFFVFLVEVFWKWKIKIYSLKNKTNCYFK